MQRSECNTGSELSIRESCWSTVSTSDLERDEILVSQSSTSALHSEFSVDCAAVVHLTSAREIPADSAAPLRNEENSRGDRCLPETASDRSNWELPVFES